MCTNRKPDGRSKGNIQATWIESQFQEIKIRSRPDVLRARCQRNEKNSPGRSRSWHYFILDGYPQEKLRFQGRYKHLGTQQEAAGGLEQEIQFLIGVTWAAYRTLRPLLCKKTLPAGMRLSLAGSLLWSKLFYGAGSWHGLSEQQTHKIHVCYLGLIRRIVGQTHKKGEANKTWTDKQILAHFLAC